MKLDSLIEEIEKEKAHYHAICSAYPVVLKLTPETYESLRWMFYQKIVPGVGEKKEIVQINMFKGMLVQLDNSIPVVEKYRLSSDFNKKIWQGEEILKAIREQREKEEEMIRRGMELIERYE